MPKPILVGFDPRAADRAPVDFGLAAARFTGAPLVVGCVCAGKIHERPAGQVEEDLAEEAAAALEQLQRELETDEAAVTYRELQGTSAARALHEAAEQQDAGLLVVARRGVRRWDACFPARPRTVSCTARRARLP